eukprot:2609196-Amphidinium_carterae.1
MFGVSTCWLGVVEGFGFVMGMVRTEQPDLENDDYPIEDFGALQPSDPRQPARGKKVLALELLSQPKNSRRDEFNG